MYLLALNKKILLFAVLALLFGQISFTQSLQYRNYSTEQGLCNRFVNTLNQDEQGFIWIGTGSGLCRYDGIEFQSGFLPDSLSETNFSVSYKDKLGNLWFGSNDGLVVEYENGNFRVFNTQKISFSLITGFIEDPDGKIIASTQNNGLIMIDPSEPENLTQFQINRGLIFSISKTHSGKILIGSDNGLFIYSLPLGNQPPQLVRKVEEFPSVKVQTLLTSGTSDLIFVGTEDKGIYILKSSAEESTFSVVSITQESKFSKANIQAFMEDDDKNLWVSFFRLGIIKISYPVDTEGLKYEEYNEGKGLISNNTKAIYQDFEGNIWIGTYGSGLSMLMNEAFTFLTFDETSTGASINSIAVDEECYLFAGDYGIMIMDKVTGLPRQTITHINGLPEDKITSLYYSDYYRKLWIGTEKSGLYFLSLNDGSVKPYYIPDDVNEKSVNHIVGDTSSLWVATKNGVFFFDLQSGTREHFTTSNGLLPHNNIKHLYIDREKNLWISTISDAPYYLSNSILNKADFPSYGLRIDFRAITIDKYGDIWAATYGYGVLHYTADTVYFITEESGLKSKYCYSIISDSEERIWIGHKQGFSRLSRVSADEQIIKTCGEENGISGDANFNSVFLDENNILLLGTTKGVVLYDYQKDRKILSPPKVNITTIKFDDDTIPLNEKIIMPYAHYKLRIDFIGISYQNPEQVTYQYKLENYSDWSDFDQFRYAVFPRLGDGEYKFLLRAYNADFQTTDEFVGFDIVVKKPFWETWWFYALMTGLLVSTVVVIIKVRERNHKKLEAYLQTELNIRTKEVVEQKNEIELKNREITDSINYAQRIQASILPPVQRLKENFSGSFVYYLPRDIVSGDFYWWGRIDEDRFLIVCADSTGHGVPGAFMSMIGSTLIKDIVNRKRNIKPSELLSILDEEITTSLNQNIESHASNDGMDIIVCELNTSTYYLRFASAMRPIILYHKGEQYYIRGNRSSVGGEAMEGKIFEDQEYQLAKGDIIYLFSDGYPDQFGGPLGKKLKMVRMKNMLDDIHEKSMEDQYFKIKQNFEIWREGYEQVDDVLFMGIQI